MQLSGGNGASPCNAVLFYSKAKALRMAPINALHRIGLKKKQKSRSIDIYIDYIEGGDSRKF